LGELHHPILSCHVDLVFSSTLLVSISVLEYFRPAALVLAVIGWIGHCAFTVWRVGVLWRGGRQTGENTAVLFLPQVTGNFISALAAGRFGYMDLAALFLGAGAMSWVPVEAAVIARLFSHEMPAALRPTLGIRLSPPATACVAYLTIRNGVPDLLVNCLLGYALLQAAVLLRLAGWIRTQDFVSSYWGFSFGLAALGWCMLSVARAGLHGTLEYLALPVFVVENLVIMLFLVLTVKYLMRGEGLTTGAGPTMRTDCQMLERMP
jgi:tellurite resistance protein